MLCCLTSIVGLVRINVFAGQQCFNHFFVAITCCPQQRGSVIIVRLVSINIFARQQRVDHLVVVVFCGQDQRCFPFAVYLVSINVITRQQRVDHFFVAIFCGHVARGLIEVPTNSTFKQLKKKAKKLRRAMEDSDDSDDDAPAPSAKELKAQLRIVQLDLERCVVDLARHAVTDWPELRLRYANIVGDVLSSGGDGSVGVRTMDDFDDVEPLGGSGRVVIHSGTLDGQRMAIKAFTLVGNREKESFLKEARLLRSLQHNYVAEMVGVFMSERKHEIRGHIVMPLYAGGDLWAWSVSASPSSLDKLRVMRQTLCGVDHIHRNGVVHGDIKPGNIFIELCEHGPVARIGDFGVSKDDTARTITVIKYTVRYAAPELEKPGAKATKESDMFAYGLTLYDVLCSSSETTERKLNLTKLHQYDVSESNGLQTFVASLLDSNPSKRPDSFLAQRATVFMPQPDKTVSRTDLVRCVYCLDDVWKGEGLVCRDGHVICGACTIGSLRAECDKSLPYICQRGGLMCGAGDCSNKDPFPIGDLAIASRKDPAVLDAFLARLEEARKSEYAMTAQRELEVALEEQARRLAAENEHEKTKRFTTHIVEKILNLCCPRCNTMFADYEGCMALYCKPAQGAVGGCGGYFCALCLTQSPTSQANHAHVRRCPFNVHQNVFDQGDVFERAQKERRTRLLREYFDKSVPPHLKPLVIKQVTPHLEPLGITLDWVWD